MGLVSGWSLANHSNSESFLVAHAQPRWMLSRGILGSGRTGSISSRPFPNSSGWWWLISSVLLIRISCHKTTHANGYYGAWPGWAVSISVLPLTTGHIWTSLVAQTVKNLPAVMETWVRPLGWDNPLEKGMATHSSIVFLPGKFPWTEEPGRLQCMRSQRVTHD